MGNSLDETQRSQMACTFAALLLHDDRTEVNAESLAKVVNAAGVNVPAYWPMLFANALAGKDIGSFLNVSSGSAQSKPKLVPLLLVETPPPKRKRKKRNLKRKRRIWISVICSDKQ